MITVELHVKRKTGLKASMIKMVELTEDCSKLSFRDISTKAKLQFLNEYISRDRQIRPFRNVEQAEKESKLEITCVASVISSQNTGRASNSLNMSKAAGK